MNISVKVLAPVNPTEIQEKVEKAILNFFPVELKLQESGVPALYGSCGLESLRTLHLRLREEHILDTARNILLNGIKGNTTRFILDRAPDHRRDQHQHRGLEHQSDFPIAESAQNPGD